MSTRNVIKISSTESADRCLASSCPPLGNIFFEATIPHSVTLIMSQFVVLTRLMGYDKLKYGV